MVKQLKISNSNQVVLVDDEDFDVLNRDNWMIRDGYVYNTRTSLRIHRMILKIGKVNEDRTNLVDHIDRNILNNQKLNLRICDDQKNSFNTGPRKNSSSKYKGVSTREGKYVATICKDGKNMKLGKYFEEIDAAIAYDFMARKLFGEFAYLNFPDVICDSYWEAIEKKRCKIVKIHSQYIGVYPAGSRWVAKVKFKQKNINIGLFETEVEAAKAHDSEAIQRLGNLAKINFPHIDYSTYVINNIKIVYTSKYECVTLCSTTGKWKVTINQSGQSTYVGSFNTEEKAGEVADFFNIKNNNPNPRNFPDKNYTNYQIPKGIKKTETDKSSKYNCITANKNKNVFSVNIKINKKNLYVGSFKDELDAATTADFYNYKFNGHKRKLNFPDIIDNIFQLAYC